MLKRYLIKVALFVGISAAFVLCDHFLKHYMEKILADYNYIFLDGLLALKLSHNTGMSFGMLHDGTIFVTVASIVGLSLIAALVFGSKMLKSYNGAWLGMIMGGGISNLIDRFANAPYNGRGYVIDYISYANLFIGNVADIFILIGVVGFAISGFFSIIATFSGGSNNNIPMKLWGSTAHAGTYSSTKTHNRK